MTPIKAIRAKCLECMCGSRYEVKMCVCSGCPLWEFRLGHNPHIKRRELTEEQRAAIAARLNQPKIEAQPDIHTAG